MLLNWTNLAKIKKQVVQLCFYNANFQLFTGATDFLGLNFYTSSIVYPKDDRTDVSYDADKGTGAKADPNWIGSS